MEEYTTTEDLEYCNYFGLTDIIINLPENLDENE